MSGNRILVVDDEPDIRDLVREILEDEGYRVSVAADAEVARSLRREIEPDLALLDIWMPGTDGITLLQEWQQGGSPEVPVIMMSGHGTIETAVEATRLGAFDFIEKPLSLTRLLLTVRRALARDQPTESTAAGQRKEWAELIGSSRLLSDLRESVRRVAQTTSPVLIHGEVGVGRHTTAHVIHQQSGRSGMPCVDFDVATFGPNSRASDLFGPPGPWSEAAGGTLVLADLGELPFALQSELAVRLDASAATGEPRVIGVTAEAPERLVEQGRLRSDLVQRFAISLAVPALRDHAEDVPDLVSHIVDRLVEQHGLPYRHFPVAAQNRLRHHPWPGNVAGLAAVVQRLLVMGEKTEVDVVQVDEALAEAETVLSATMRLPLELPLREARDEFERVYLEHHLRAVGGRIGELAQRVGMERTHLYRKLKNLGIDHTRNRG